MHAGWLIYIAAFALVTLAAALFIRAVLAVVTVEHESMSPTLESGDRVLVLRRFPSSWIGSGRIVIVYPWHMPPNGPKPFGVKSPYIKRVVGMPGDTLVTTLADLNDHFRSRQAAKHDRDGRRTWHIPAGHCFVRGDNPLGSYDSLTWGPVPTRCVLGIVINKLARRESVPTPALPHRTLPIGQPAPEFAAQTLDEHTVTADSFAGRAYVIVFFSSNGPNREVIAGLEAVRRTALKAGIEMVLVSVDHAAGARAFRDQFGLRGRVLVAPWDENPFVSDYKIPGTPFYTLIDDRGLVQSTGFPNRSFPEWDALLASWQVFETEGSMAYALE